MLGKNLFQKIVLISMLLLLATTVMATHVVSSVDKPTGFVKGVSSVEFAFIGPAVDGPFTAQLEYAPTTTFGTANITTMILNIGTNCFGTSFDTGVVCSFNSWNSTSA